MKDLSFGQTTLMMMTKNSSWEKVHYISTTYFNKKLEVTRGKIWAVRRVLKCFPAKSLKLILHQIGSMGKDNSVRQNSRAFWLYGTSEHPQPPRNEPHLSALLCLPPFPMLVRTHFTLRSPPEQYRNNFLDQCVFTMHASYPTDGSSIRNNIVANFCEECVLWRVFHFHLSVPHILKFKKINF